ncbi:thioredoxin family protein, partial [bacterium]|nr:thioredoxin family protein [bacterium]
ADWFTTDSVTLRGRIEGYSPEAGFPTQLELSYTSVFDKDELVMVADIRPDGTFEKRWEVDHPKQHSFRWDKALPGMNYLEVFARPGETINVTVRRGEDGLYRCIYHDGSSQAVERWLKSGLDFGGFASRMYHFKGTPGEAEALAEKLWKLIIYRLQTVAVRHNFTPMEMQLAMADAQVQHAMGVMDYALGKMFDANMVTAADSAVYAALRDTAFYGRLLRRIDFDNPLLMANGYYEILLNRIQYAWPVIGADGPVEITDEIGPWTNTPESILKEMENRYAKWRGMMGCTNNNLMAQMCNYQEMLDDYKLWCVNEITKDRVLSDPKLSEDERKQQAASVPCLSNVFPRYVASFSHEALRRHAERFHAARQAMAALTSPLPEGQPAELIRSLQARYPGRYLVIDFWGMGCGPCRSAIQSSKELRAEIAKRDDVKLVFIAGEATAEGSEAYHKYVKEWLADEETICIPDTEFSRLQEYFRFNGIPHYETITPDGRRVGEEYRINGLYNFDSDMKRLLQAFDRESRR